MMKRQIKYENMQNSPAIRKDIINKINYAMYRTWEFSTSQNGNNRSSTKTDYLHDSLREIILCGLGDSRKKFHEEFEFIAETNNSSKKTKKIKMTDIFGRNFSVDAVIKKDNQIHTVFLLKSALTSPNKNKYNTIENMVGQIDRFYGCKHNKNINLVFISLTPEETFTKKGNKLTKEIVDYLGLNYIIKEEDNGEITSSTFLEKSIVSEYSDRLTEIHIEYKLNFDVDLSLITDMDTLKEKIKDGKLHISSCDKNLIHLENYITDFIQKNL